MSQDNPRTTPVAPPPESQSERWLKYGTNVVVASVAVVAIALLLVWLSGKYNNRLDTTAAGLYSLKPQTLNVIRNNSQPIKIVSLYTSARDERESYEEERARGEIDRGQVVADLLEEYKEKGNNIQVEVIDPATQSSKVDQLIEEVTRTSGPEVQKYKAVMEAFPKAYEKIEAVANEQAQKMREMGAKIESVEDINLVMALNETFQTVARFPAALKALKEDADRQLKQRIPDYRGAVDRLRLGISPLSQRLEGILNNFKQYRDDPKIPEPVRTYMTAATPRFEEMKKLSDNLDKQIKELGELKLDQLKQSLKEPNTILVMGASEWRVLPADKVWQVPADSRGFSAEGKRKPRFAGEQQVTGAIISLTGKAKPKVAIVRGGGPPWASRGFRSGPLSILAGRLGDYNFDVVEKDITGMWEMQARMQGGFAPPEPSEDEIKDAVWIVVNLPSQRGPMPSAGALGTKLADHLKRGGSALVLSVPEAEDLSPALKEWGVELRTNAVAVHEPIKPGPAGSTDPLEDILRLPFFFTVREYGEHTITKPVNSLEGVLIECIPVETRVTPGYTAARIIPIPQTLRTWGETSLDKLRGDPETGGGSEVVYDKNLDLSPPLYGGAAVEKQGGGRLVAIGSLSMPTNQVVSFEDPVLARKDIYALRFPANLELTLNSVFWLAKMEHLIALSPSAMEVPRLREIPTGALNFWRIGVLLVLLPLAVVLSGVGVFLKRRD